MAKTLADLDASTLGYILDLCDCSVLFWLVEVGNHALTNKVYRSALRFEFTYPHPWRRAPWPKMLTRFHALEYVSVSIDEPDHSISVYDVDLLALPATLTSLKLKFSNALFTLIELPPADYESGPYTPRLRQDLKHKLKNLKSLTWTHDCTYQTEEWDFSDFVEDLQLWAPCAKTPSNLPTISLDRAMKAANTTYSLTVDCEQVDEEPTTSLPSSLLRLTMNSFDSYSGNGFALLPPSLETLCLNGDVETFESLLRLQHLTSLEVSVSCPCDTELLRKLPPTLRLLHLYCTEAELESFAHFAPSLTSLSVQFEEIYSSTTDERTDAIFHEPLPHDFLPSMRESVVAHLPRNLVEFGEKMFQMVNPSDWDALPRNAKRLLKEEEHSERVTFNLTHEKAPYMHLLPPHLLDSVIVYNVCTIPMAAALPKSCTKLELPVLSYDLRLRFDRGSKQESQAVAAHAQALFEAVSQNTPLLRDLDIHVDETFDFALLQHLTLPLESLSVGVSRRWEEGDFEQLMQEKRAAMETLQVSPALFSLKRLAFSGEALSLFQSVLPRIFGACSALVEVELKHNSRMEPETIKTLPANWLSLLPPTLTSLEATLDILDTNTFKALPRALQKFTSPVAMQKQPWKFEDLRSLPTTLHHLSLPLPEEDLEDEDAAIEAIENVFAGFLQEVRYEIGELDGDGDVTLTFDPEGTTLETLLEDERIFREGSEEEEDEDLPSLRNRTKRKRE